ncbi:purine and uridine phosphorylase [Trichoderma chlorosporum]
MSYTQTHTQICINAYRGIKEVTRGPLSTKPCDRRGFEIAIICALPLEFDAVSLVFDEFWDEEGDVYRRAAGDENTYTTGRRIGKFNVVLILLSRIGKVSAASATASARWSYPNLRLALLVGVCGGVPRARSGEEMLLGDVIISDTIVQYDLGRQYPNQFVRKRTAKGNIGGSNKEIRNLLASFRTRHHRSQLQRRTAAFLRQLQAKAAEVGQEKLYNYPGSTHDQLFMSSYRHKHHIPPECICRHCNAKADPVCETALNTLCSTLGCGVGHDRDQLLFREKLELKRELEKSSDERAQEPTLFLGAIASGDIVMESGEDRDEISRREDVIAFEMESAGVSEIIPCIVVKGVSDYADSHKNNLLQNFSAATAAATAKAILERYIQSDKSV